MQFEPRLGRSEGLPLSITDNQLTSTSFFVVFEDLLMEHTLRIRCASQNVPIDVLRQLPANIAAETTIVVPHLKLGKTLVSRWILGRSPESVFEG